MKRFAFSVFSIALLSVSSGPAFATSCYFVFGLCVSCDAPATCETATVRGGSEKLPPKQSEAPAPVSSKSVRKQRLSPPPAPPPPPSRRSKVQPAQTAGAGTQKRRAAFKKHVAKTMGRDTDLTDQDVDRLYAHFETWLKDRNAR